jgi:hypothetical protein
MNTKALNELFEIIKIEGISRSDGARAREISLLQWVKDNTVEIEHTQNIIEKSISSEDLDFIKYHMATQMAEKLMDNCIHVNVSKTKVTTKIRAFKRK